MLRPIAFLRCCLSFPFLRAIVKRSMHSCKIPSSVTVHCTIHRSYPCFTLRPKSNMPSLHALTDCTTPTFPPNALNSPTSCEMPTLLSNPLVLLTVKDPAGRMVDWHRLAGILLKANIVEAVFCGHKSRQALRFDAFGVFRYGLLHLGIKSKDLRGWS